MNRAFITGSLAYGTPTESSDCDLVILVSQEDLQRLINVPGVADKSSEVYGSDSDVSANLAFGKLNLIAFADEDEFNSWKEATDDLIRRRPVSRHEAVIHIEATKCRA